MTVIQDSVYQFVVSLTMINCRHLSCCYILHDHPSIPSLLNQINHQILFKKLHDRASILNESYELMIERNYVTEMGTMSICSLKLN